MKTLKINQFKAGLEHFLSLEERNLRIGEKMALIAIIALFETQDTATKKEIIGITKAKAITTYKNIKLLEDKGYVESARSNQFYSRSFLTLTDKGNYFASRLRRILNT